MDPFGAIAFAIDSIERVQAVLDQVRNNNGALATLTIQVAAHLTDLDDILQPLQSKAQKGMQFPATFERDLEQMKSGFLKSADALLALSPPPGKSGGFLKRAAAKSRLARDRDQISGILRTVERDTQSMMRRFSVRCLFGCAANVHCRDRQNGRLSSAWRSPSSTLQSSLKLRRRRKASARCTPRFRSLQSR
jgi:hypothetical protein